PRIDRSPPESCRVGWPRWTGRAPGPRSGRGSGGRRTSWRRHKDGRRWREAVINVVGQTHHSRGSPPMKFLLAAALLATLVAERRPVQMAVSKPGAGPGAVYSHNLSVQDTQSRVLLRLEDDWALALIRRDAAVFRRLLADGFIYTEDDRTVSRDDVLHDVVAGLDTVTAAHNEAMRVHRFGATPGVTCASGQGSCRLGRAGFFACRGERDAPGRGARVEHGA